MSDLNTTGQIKVGNLKKVDPTMADLMNIVMKQLKLDLNCHAIATIQDFDSTTQTVRATINYKKVFVTNTQNGSFTPFLKDYPLLVGIPLIIYGAGTANITLPKSEIIGATCILLFNDRDIDNWAVSGQITAPATERLHSLTDGMALLCVRPSGSPLLNYDEDRLNISFNKTFIAIGELVEINNVNGKSLGDILTDLTTALNNLTTLLTTTFAASTATPGSPLSAAFAAAVVPIVTEISQVQTEIEGLLE